MNLYEVKKIDVSKTRNADEYAREIEQAVPEYCVGLASLRRFCGNYLHRERCGYTSKNGNIEYIAVKISRTV